MPDLKSEMSKVINSWETDMPTAPTNASTSHRITNNATRITFNYVRDNPGVTRGAAIAALSKLGVKPGSSTSLLYVMVTRGNLRRTAEGALFAVQAEYKHLPTPKPKATPARAAPVAEVPKAPEPVQINFSWDADTLLNNLSIKQARALYDELRKIFGG